MWFAKAFDNLKHSIVFKKCAIPNIDSFWLNIYLKNRTQSVKFKETSPSTISVQFGVHQGSMLGPIMFHIYVKDMKGYISGCTLVQYADNTQLLHLDGFRFKWTDTCPLKRISIKSAKSKVYANLY